MKHIWNWLIASENELNVLLSSSDNTHECLSKRISDLKAEFSALKSFVIDEFYRINVNLDQVWTEQRDQIEYLEEKNKTMWDDIATKTMIYNMVSENLNKIQIPFII